VRGPPAATAEAPGLHVRLAAAAGARALAVAREAGAYGLVLLRTLAALFPPDLDRRELARQLHRVGVQSLPIVALTAFLTGGIMIVQAGWYVRRYGAYSLVGWGVGFATLREVGPVLIALMFSGRVGSHNTAELATMATTEQVDALRVLGVDPVRYLLVPRVFAMMLMLFALTAFSDLLALAGGAWLGDVMLGVDPALFFASFRTYVHVEDLLHGLVKAAAFGVAVAVVSCRLGLAARGGAPGVGRAVTSSVVASAVLILLLDWALTGVLP